MASFDIFASNLLSCDDVKLGQLIAGDLSDPIEDYFNSETIVLNEATIATGRYDNFSSAFSGSSSNKVAATLTTLLSGLFSRRSSLRSQLDSVQFNFKLLKNYPERFKEVCEDGKVEKWLGERYRLREKMYMVVGIITALNIEIRREDESARTIEGQATLPISQATGVPSTAVDVKLAASSKKMASNFTSYSAPGERIVAFRYCKIKCSKVESGFVIQKGARLRISPAVTKGTHVKPDFFLQVEVEELGKEDLEEFSYDSMTAPESEVIAIHRSE